tara:strand:+ start:104 stop:718 length:615 start_codon:yes stop_codon:yes gene_type:complete
MFKLKYHLLFVSIIPFIAIHLSFILSVQNEYLSLCNPYIDGCYSISRVARQPSSIIIFKVLILVSALSLFFLWPRLFKPKHNKTLILIGRIGSLFLIAYIVALGEEGFLYELMRRFGVFIFYVFTLISQWVFTFNAEIRKERFFVYNFFINIIVYIQFLTFLVAIPFFLFIKNYGYIENIIEWWITLFITLWFFMNFIYYRKND